MYGDYAYDSLDEYNDYAYDDYTYDDYAYDDGDGDDYSYVSSSSEEDYLL